MKTPLFLALASLFLLAGCETDDSVASASENFQDMALGAPPPGVHTVVMMVETAPDSADITVNGMKLGFSPRELHLPVNDEGRLTMAVTIGITYNVGSGVRMAMGGGGQGAQPRSTSYTYKEGDRVPSKLSFSSDMRIASRVPAPYDTKPAAPDAHRVGGGD